MSAVALPRLRVGQPVRHEALSVFPLFCEPADDVEYRLSEAALADESLLIEEVSEGGSVPDLQVENQGDVRVLLLEGEELIGAKQNRILNTSVLVPARSKIKIPVSCVEQGRWAYRARSFGSSGSHSPSRLRRALKASVSRSVRERRGHRSDQNAVWKEVACLHASHAVESSTVAMSDAFDTHQGRIAEYLERTKYVEGATGLAVAVGGRVLSIDVFDKPATCRQVWGRLLTGVVFDALEAGADERTATAGDVEHLLKSADELPWAPAPAVGEGQEYRAESRRGDHASALALQDTIVHSSLVAGE